jgi:preprotein translocase subunit SecA
MSAMGYAARYAVPCGIVPEREFAPDRTFLSSPWARARAFWVSREAARAVFLANACESNMRGIDDAALGERLASLLPTLRRRRIETMALAEGLGIAREIADRSLGQRAFDEQLFAAFVLLRGGLAEMATGEGKTLTASIAGAVAAGSGLAVHVISSNDYLVARDASTMAPFYEAMGLSVGQVLSKEPDREERARGYRANITYLTPHELAFDYLRDRRVLGSAGPLGRHVARIGGQLASGLRQRGLGFAIVDEADDVLLDQARTPFVLSEAAEGVDAEAPARVAYGLAKDLVETRDYTPVRVGNPPRLTDEGIARVRATGEASGFWSRPSECRDWVEMALFSMTGLTRDVDYVVREGGIHIVDTSTGRRSPEQSFERGLHQLLETKEGLDVSGPASGRRRIAGQALFRRYERLSALTGTAAEARAELWRVYGLPVVRVPLRRPSRKVGAPIQCHPDDDAQLEAIFQRVAQMHSDCRPVLVGTGSVDASRRLATALTERGVETHLLNAADDAEEARIIAEAGLAGRVTVTTNMAGRGTDIVLAHETARLGGLHIICARVGESRRVDRQLIGRCGRQGDPGSFETILSLSDPLFQARLPAALLRWVHEKAVGSEFLTPWIIRILLWGVQIAEERRGGTTRRDLLALQRARDELLAFAGTPE